MAFLDEDYGSLVTQGVDHGDPRFFFVDVAYKNLVSVLVVGIVLVLSLTVLALLGLVLFALLFTRKNSSRHHHLRKNENGHNTYDFRSRTINAGYDAINVLYMLEEAFRKLEVDDYECQQRIVCEAHEANAPTKYGRIAGRIQKIIGSAEDAAADEADEEVAAAFRTFRDAAVRGIQQEDCQLVYSAKCPKGLRDIISSGTKY